MKSLLLVSAVTAMVSVTAASADDADVQSQARFDWTGEYVGASIGYGWGNSKLDYDNSGYFARLDPSGFAGGIYAGFNRQLANGVVVGLEGDIQISGVGSSNVLGYFGGVDLFRRFFSDQEWNAALRARLGYAADRFMPYVAGGLAVARYGHGETEHPITAFSLDATYLGWTSGVGLEFAATEKLILRAEYRYSDFGSRRFTPTANYPHVVDLKSSDLRIGVYYKF